MKANFKNTDIGSPVVKKEDINTNNGWGFGGKRGTKFYFENGFIEFRGMYDYRHTGSSSAHDWHYAYDEHECSAQILSTPVEHIYLVLDSNNHYTPLAVGSATEIEEEKLKKMAYKFVENPIVKKVK